MDSCSRQRGRIGIGLGRVQRRPVARLAAHFWPKLYNTRLGGAPHTASPRGDGSCPRRPHPYWTVPNAQRFTEKPCPNPVDGPCRIRARGFAKFCCRVGRCRTPAPLGTGNAAQQIQTKNKTTETAAANPLTTADPCNPQPPRPASGIDLAPTVTSRPDRHPPAWAPRTHTV